jgi:hypothetical protein
MFAHNWHHHADVSDLIAVVGILLFVRLLMSLVAIALVAAWGILAFVRGQNVPRVSDAERHLSSLASEATAEASDVVGSVSDPAPAKAQAVPVQSTPRAATNAGAHVTSEPTPWR